MASVSRELLENQANNINRLSDALTEALTLELSNLQYNSMSDLRTQARNIAVRYIQAACDSANASEKVFYEACALEQTGKVQNIDVSYTIDEGAIDGAIRGFIDDVINGDYDKFIKEICSKGDYEIRKAAAKSSVLRMEKDKRVLKFARVPSGAETCTFCLLLSSRGAVYATVTSAGGDWNHYHANCDCRIVPDYTGNLQIDGYHPELLAEKFSKIRQTIEQTVTKEWQALSDEEKAEYKDFNEYQAYQIAKEARKRDIEWLKDDKPTINKKELGAKPSKKEQDVAEILNKNGFNTIARCTRSDEQKRTSDLYIANRDGSGKTAWEIKSPTGTGNQNIYHQFEDAAGQSERLIIDLSQLKGDRKTIRKTVSDKANKLIYYHYTNEKTGKPFQFREVLIIDGEDYMQRIKRKG